jgi:hypothetical protein
VGPDGRREGGARSSERKMTYQFFLVSSFFLVVEIILTNTKSVATAMCRKSFLHEILIIFEGPYYIREQCKCSISKCNIKCLMAQN